MTSFAATAPYTGPCEVTMTPEGTTIDHAVQTITEQAAPESHVSVEEDHTNGLIADLAWILLLAAFATLLFKKLKQPVVLGYILAGFLASPKFTYLPSISNLENIEFWADLGIVVLMFTLGLEFSFKKLMNSGSSAMVTALVIITGMTMAGFGVGCLLHLDTINCVFLGGMISMSSTTIILKAFTDLGLKQKKFASLVLAVLFIEDLFAVLMLVLLSSVAMGDVKGSELLFSIAKLAFFLIIWFVVGVYVTQLHRKYCRVICRNLPILHKMEWVRWYRFRQSIAYTYSPFSSQRPILSGVYSLRGLVLSLLLFLPFSFCYEVLYFCYRPIGNPLSEEYSDSEAYTKSEYIKVYHISSFMNCSIGILADTFDG